MDWLSTSTAFPLTLRRYRMVLSLHDWQQSEPRAVLQSNVRLVPWSSTLVKEHGRIKFESFRSEMDSSVFRCLGKRDGCLRLMHDLANRSDFVAEATWLLQVVDSDPQKAISIGTIQGLRTDCDEGSIQNLGILDGYRSAGYGKLLLHTALEGFRRVGCTRVGLEVTSHNSAAIALYRKTGFKITQTTFKPAEISLA